MNQKPNYGNWVPEKMLALCYVAAAVLGIAACVTGPVLHLVIPAWILGILAAICLVYGIYMHICHELFAFGKGNMMAKVHQHLVDHLEWDGEGTLLDIGCGAAALTIRCAKAVPKAKLVGMDYWGAEWNYAKDQCERNAKAEGVVGAWIEQLNALAADPVRQRYFGLEAEDFGQFVHELIQGMSRLGLEKDMAQAVRDVSGYRNIRRDKLIWRQASMAAYCISAFVDWLGFNPASVPEARRTIQLAGRTRTLFGQQPDPEGYPALAAEPLAFDRQYYTDWLAALMHLIEGNADYEDGQTFDPEQNARLGRLINNLNPSVFTQDN